MIEPAAPSTTLGRPPVRVPAVGSGGAGRLAPAHGRVRRGAVVVVSAAASGSGIGTGKSSLSKRSTSTLEIIA
jgi:hypothetical protein